MLVKEADRFGGCVPKSTGVPTSESTGLVRKHSHLKGDEFSIQLQNRNGVESHIQEFGYETDGCRKCPPHSMESLATSSVCAREKQDLTR